MGGAAVCTAGSPSLFCSSAGRGGLGGGLAGLGEISGGFADASGDFTTTAVRFADSSGFGDCLVSIAGITEGGPTPGLVRGSSRNTSDGVVSCVALSGAG